MTEQRQSKIYSLVGGGVYDVSYLQCKPLVWSSYKIPSARIAPSDGDQGILVGIFQYCGHCVVQNMCVSVAGTAAVVQRPIKSFGHDRALWAHPRSVA